MLVSTASLFPTRGDENDGIGFWVVDLVYGFLLAAPLVLFKK